MPAHREGQSTLHVRRHYSILSMKSQGKVSVVKKKLLRAVINSVPDQLNHNLLSHTKIFCAALGFKFVGGVGPCILIGRGNLHSIKNHVQTALPVFNCF